MTDINHITLDNGLHIVIEKMTGVKSAALCWLLPAGASHDPESSIGISALWSELLLRGAGDLDSRAQADAFDRIGVSRSTRLSSRFLSIDATTLGSRLHEALPPLVEMVRRPRFDQGSIEPVRELCLQAIEALEDEPGERCALGARQRHLPAPFNRSTLGEAEAIRAITRDQIVSGWAERAVPGGSILAIAGAVEPEQAIEQLRQLLDGWEGARPDPAPRTEPPRAYAHEEDDTNQVQIVLAADAPAESHPDSMIERLAVSVLSGGMSSRLFTEVREKRGLCYSVHARYSADRDFGVLGADVGTQPDRAQESLDVLTAELHRIASPEGRVTPEEFARAVAGMKSRLVFSGESTGARAGAIAGDLFRLGRPRTLREIADRIDAISLDSLNGYLQSRALGRVTVQSVGPRPLEMPASLR